MGAHCSPVIPRARQTLAAQECPIILKNIPERTCSTLSSGKNCLYNASYIVGLPVVDPIAVPTFPDARKSGSSPESETASLAARVA